MASQSCEFLISAEDVPGPARWHSFGWNEHLQVRDLSTRCDIRVIAGEVSPYRHTLYLGGRIFRILNIVKGVPA
jgi:hypothetical protein